MSAVKKEKPSAAGTAKGNGNCPGGRIYLLHNNTSKPIRQIIRGATAWLSVLGLLGVIGGMERGSVGELAGAIWLAALLAGFVWGCRPWMS